MGGKNLELNYIIKNPLYKFYKLYFIDFPTCVGFNSCRNFSNETAEEFLDYEINNIYQVIQ